MSASARPGVWFDPFRSFKAGPIAIDADEWRNCLTPKESIRMRAVLRSIHVLIVPGASLSGSLAVAADASHGADLAKRWCAACHLTGGDQTQTSTEAPPFAVVARKPDFTAEG